MESTRKVIPTVVVGRSLYKLIAYDSIKDVVLHGKRHAKFLPDYAQEIGDNEVIFPTGPKQMTFRRRFSFSRVTKSVRYITADNSDRYDLKIFIHLK